MTLLQTPPKPQTIAQIRQQRSLVRGISLRSHAHLLSPAAFQARKAYLVSAYQDGAFLADPEARGKPRPNPMADPAAMEGMMGAMKGNVVMMVPQTLIMGWINAFFSGFVIRGSPIALSPVQKPRRSDMASKTAFSIDTAVQVNAAVRRRHARPRRALGVKPILVFPYAVWAAARLQLPAWRRQW